MNSLDPLLSGCGIRRGRPATATMMGIWREDTEKHRKSKACGAWRCFVKPDFLSCRKKTGAVAPVAK
jgi:hypothetical protein